VTSIVAGAGVAGAIGEGVWTGEDVVPHDHDNVAKQAKMMRAAVDLIGHAV